MGAQRGRDVANGRGSQHAHKRVWLLRRLLLLRHYGWPLECHIVSTVFDAIALVRDLLLALGIPNGQPDVTPICLQDPETVRFKMRYRGSGDSPLLSDEGGKFKARRVKIKGWPFRGPVQQDAEPQVVRSGYKVQCMQPGRGQGEEAQGAAGRAEGEADHRAGLRSCSSQEAEAGV